MRTRITTLAALAAAAVATSSAQADSHYGHSHGPTYVRSIGPTGSYTYPSTTYHFSTTYPGYPSYPTVIHRPYRTTAVWHDTTHVDVTPARWVRTSYGWRYIPSRQTLHVDGHYDHVPTHVHHHHH